MTHSCWHVPRRPRCFMKIICPNPFAVSPRECDLPGFLKPVRVMARELFAKRGVPSSGDQLP